MNNGLRQFHAEYTTSVFERSLGNNIAAHSCFGYHLCVEVVEADAPEFPGLQVIGKQLINSTFDAGSRNISFETTALAAIAIAACRVYGSVAYFAGNTMLAVEKNAVANKPAAQTGAECDHNKVFHAFRVA